MTCLYMKNKCAECIELIQNKDMDMEDILEKVQCTMCGELNIYLSSGQVIEQMEVFSCNPTSVKSFDELEFTFVNGDGELFVNAKDIVAIYKRRD